MWYYKSRLFKYILVGFLCLCLVAVTFIGFSYPWKVGANTQQKQNSATAASAPTPEIIATPQDTTHWQLVFDDEFNNNYIDTSKWNIQDTPYKTYRSCCLNYGDQAFTPQAFSFENGSMRITTAQQNLSDYPYTSGALTTENKFSFTYGKIEVRARLPTTQGLWSAFWLINDGTTKISPYEIDMVEFLGKNPRTAHMAEHWERHESAIDYTSTTDYSQGYHTYTVIWGVNNVTWYIDGIQRFQATQHVSSRSMYLIINASIDGHWGGPTGPNTVLPQHLDVDYVHIYQAQPGDSKPGS